MTAKIFGYGYKWTFAGSATARSRNDAALHEHKKGRAKLSPSLHEPVDCIKYALFYFPAWTRSSFLPHTRRSICSNFR